MRTGPPTVEELVSEFISGEDITMGDGLSFNSELVWQAILQVLQHPLSDEPISVLAAGPLEDLLVRNGAQFIRRIKVEAFRQSTFANLRGGVWRRNMPEALWQRVETARGGKVW